MALIGLGIFNNGVTQRTPNSQRADNQVSLDKEINYIENFVDLKLLKDSRAMNVQVDLDKTASNILIPPLLFIPFVENAFKHSKIENSFNRQSI